MTNAKPNLPKPQDGAKWCAIKTGTGRITGYMELWHNARLGWVSIPGCGRFADADGRISDAE